MYIKNFIVVKNKKNSQNREFFYYIRLSLIFLFRRKIIRHIGAATSAIGLAGAAMEAH